MGLILSETANTVRALVPAGAHPALCIGIFDLGMQPGSGDYPPRQKVMFRFELPEERVARDGQTVPQTMTKEFTASFNEKGSLRPFLESWRGRPFTDEELKRFELTRVLGAPCLLNVVHTPKGERTYDDIKSIMPLPKGMSVPDVSFHDAFVYDRDAENEAEMRLRLPEWIVTHRLDRIVKSAAAAGPGDDRAPPVEAYAGSAF